MPHLLFAGAGLLLVPGRLLRRRLRVWLLDQGRVVVLCPGLQGPMLGVLLWGQCMPLLRVDEHQVRLDGLPMLSGTSTSPRRRVLGLHLATCAVGASTVPVLGWAGAALAPDLVRLLGLVGFGLLIGVSASASP
jgi:hypothetical protein